MTNRWYCTNFKNGSSRLDLLLYRLRCSKIREISTNIPHVTPWDADRQTSLLTSFREIQNFARYPDVLVTKAIGRRHYHTPQLTMGHWQLGEARAPAITQLKRGALGYGYFRPKILRPEPDSINESHSSGHSDSFSRPPRRWRQSKRGYRSTSHHSTNTTQRMSVFDLDLWRMTYEDIPCPPITNKPSILVRVFFSFVLGATQGNCWKVRRNTTLCTLPHHTPK